MPALPIGTYDIRIELSGFATVVREGHRLGVGESAVVGFTMKLATLAETLTVTGESPLVADRAVGSRRPGADRHRSSRCR